MTNTRIPDKPVKGPLCRFHTHKPPLSPGYIHVLFPTDIPHRPGIGLCLSIWNGITSVQVPTISPLGHCHVCALMVFCPSVARENLRYIGLPRAPGINSVFCPDSPEDPAWPLSQPHLELGSILLTILWHSNPLSLLGSLLTSKFSPQGLAVDFGVCLECSDPLFMFNSDDFLRG